MAPRRRLLPLLLAVLCSAASLGPRIAAAATPTEKGTPARIVVAPVEIPGATVQRLSKAEAWKRVQSQHDSVVEMAVALRGLRSEARELARIAPAQTDVERLMRELSALEREIEKAWRRTAAVVSELGRHAGPVPEPTPAVAARPVRQPVTAAR